jgi:hypothetical protein
MNTVRSMVALGVVSAGLILGAGATALGANGNGDETLRLHLGSDGTQFVYSNGGDPVTQAIGTPKNCQITVEGPLASIDGSDRGPGLKDGSIGIKTGGSTGVPCARVDATEDLTVSLDGVPAAVRASLDLEFKGDVRLDIVVSRGSDVETFQVRTGGGIVAGEGVDGSATAPFTATATSAEPVVNCRNASDSGPDAGPADNCYVTIEPTSAFDAVEFRPVSGEVSLEGSGDFGNDPAFDTIFTLGDGFDGELGCTETNNTATIEEGSVYGSITRLTNPDGSECVLKPYTLRIDTTEESLTFIPVDNAGAPQSAAYRATLKFAPQDSANPFTSHLRYDQDDDGPLGLEDVPWCAGDPFAAPDVPGSIDTSVIPAGDTWCIVSESTGIESATQTRTTWDVVGVGDPKML